MNYQRPELRDRLASEYVLGTLHGQARARFEKLRRQDALLDAAVLAWENRLIPLAGSVSSLAPSPELLTRIETRLGFRGKPEKQGWFAWLLKPAVGWVAAGLFVGVATTRLVDTIIPAPQTAQVAQLPASYVGVLSDPQGKAGLLVSSLRHGRTVDIKQLQPVIPPASQQAVLWGLPKNGGAPIAVGILPKTSTGSFTLPATSEVLFAEVGQLGVTYEPVGELPKSPSQPWAFIGHCGKFWM